MQIRQTHSQFLNVQRPQNQLEYEHLLELIDALTNKPEPEQLLLSGLIDLAMNYASDFEDAHNPLPDSSQPKDALLFWMEQQNVTQSDLERAGVAKQPDLSKVLSGQRQISKGMAKKLAGFFGVSPADFL